MSTERPIGGGVGGGGGGGGGVGGGVEPPARDRWDSVARIAVSVYLGVPALGALPVVLSRAMENGWGSPPAVLAGLTLPVLGLLAGARALQGGTIMPALVLAQAVVLGSLALAHPGARSAVAEAREGWAALDLLAAASGLAFVVLRRRGTRGGTGGHLKAAALATTLLIAVQAPRMTAGFARGLGGWLTRPAPTAHVGPGSVLPIASLEAMDGQRIDLARGDRAVILTFWATWCAPCLEELPRLAALSRQAPYKDHLFVSINTDRGLSNDEVLTFHRDSGLAGLVPCRDPGALLDRLGFSTIPVTILARGRRVGSVLQGYSDASFSKLVIELRRAAWRPVS